MILKREPKEKAGGDCPSTPCSLSFSEDKPTAEGCYWMTCNEGDFKPEWVPVFRKYGVLMATIDCGTYSVDDVCGGLTDVKWAHAISIPENSVLSNPPAETQSDGTES